MRKDKRDLRAKRQKGAENAAEMQKRVVAFLLRFWMEMRVSDGNAPETFRKDPPKLSDVRAAK